MNHDNHDDPLTAKKNELEDHWERTERRYLVTSGCERKEAATGSAGEILKRVVSKMEALIRRDLKIAHPFGGLQELCDHCNEQCSQGKMKRERESFQELSVGPEGWAGLVRFLSPKMRV